MNKYFYDCEFLEGTQDKRFLGIKYGKTLPTIDLISIGFVAEDGREYYAISKDFNIYEAWNRYEYSKVINIDNIPGAVVHHIESTKIYWIRENVLKPIWKQEILKMHAFTNLKEDINWEFAEFNYKNFCELIRLRGKSRKQIAEEVEDFVTIDYYKNIYPEGKVALMRMAKQDIEFYGYYSAYDHVVLCQLFGKMIDLPKGFPMLTYDLKQMLDEESYKLMIKMGHTGCGESHYANNKAFWLKTLKEAFIYPKQTNEHNALSDARWNKKLYDFIKQL